MSSLLGWSSQPLDHPSYIDNPLDTTPPIAYTHGMATNRTRRPHTVIYPTDIYERTLDPVLDRLLKEKERIDREIAEIDRQKAVIDNLIEDAKDK